MNSPLDSVQLSDLETAERLARAQELYDAGLYVQSWQAGEPLGPLSDWPGVDGQILAARLGHQLGTGRLSDWMCRRAYRAQPENASAKYFYGYVRLRRQGPYFAWRWYQENQDLPEPFDNELLGSWHALWGEVAAVMRDFETAERKIAEALEIAPESPWVRVSRATLLMQQDRYEESLAASHKALELRPWYRAGVSQIGHVLTLLDRDEEAVEFLQQGSEQLESATVSAQLFAIYLELRKYREAGEALDRVEALFPLADKRTSQWLQGQRAEIAYHLGDYEAAIRLAKESDSEFHKTVAERLEQEEFRQAPVATLPVGFVRQHHRTCGPATLAAISRYWDMSVEHLEVADEICYDGTSHYNERRWAEEHGWSTREFSVTEESTRQLIDRGVPFTFTTVEPGNAHLQAIIGYDQRRGTILIRDPYYRNSGEGLAEKVLERYRPYGPRGLALVPKSEEQRLADLDLPDCELWDELHRLDGALEHNRREEAAGVLAAMEERDARHRLTLEARRRVAIFDGNPAAHLAVLEEMLEQFPDCATMQLERLSLMRSQARREERLEIYKELCGKKETHPIFWTRYADELSDDGRQREEAVQLLRRAIRRWPTDSTSYQLLGHLYWDERRFDESLELYRFAYCLSDKDEQLAATLFSAARYFRQTEETLSLLRDRFERLGNKSGYPGRTLATALFQLERDGEALEVLEQAIKLQPEDGSLMLFTSHWYGCMGSNHLQRAEELLELARDKATRTEWLMVAARLAESNGKLHDALALWRELSELQPMNLTAHRSVVQMTAATESREAAAALLEAAVDRFPHSVPFFDLWAEWLRDEPIEVQEPLLRRGLEQFPDNAWMVRQLAFLLLQNRRVEEARELNRLAAGLEPHNASWKYLESDLLRSDGQYEAAQDMLRDVLRDSIDDDYAINRLIASCRSLAEKRAALAFVQEQLVSQVTFGDGLLAFRRHCLGTLDHEETLSALREALAERPDLWHGYSACTQQLLTMDKIEDAWSLVDDAVGRFPLLPQLWLDRSQAARARRDENEEEKSLRRALEINPTWNPAVLNLADLYERQDRAKEAAKLLRNASARNPLDPAFHQVLAETLWRLEKKEEAVERAQQAIRLEPGYDRAWEHLHFWANELPSDPALIMARELTRERAGEASSWQVLASLLDHDDQQDERDAAIEKALELDPECVDAYDLKARALAAEMKWDEALAACNAEVWGGHPPNSLKARAAWIEAERGHLAAAISRMEAVVEEAPGFFGAWSRLADWYQAAGDKEGYLRAAEALVSIDPQYEVSLGYLADARLQLGDKEGAKEVLQRAFDLDPRYDFAGNLLFDLQIDAGEVDAAAETNARVRRYNDSPEAVARSAQLAAKQGNTKPILEALRRLVADPEASPWSLDATVNAALDANLASMSEKIIAQQLDAEQCNAYATAKWVDLHFAQSKWPPVDELRKLMSRPERGRPAVRAYLETISGQANSVDSFIRAGRQWLKADPYCWGWVARTYCIQMRYRDGRSWVKDWKTRDHLEPWMLVAVVETLRAVRKLAEAHECSQLAITLPREHDQSIHHLFLGVDAALAGQCNLARSHLAEAETYGQGEWHADYGFLVKIAQAVIDMEEADPSNRATVFGRWRKELATMRSAYENYGNEPERRRLYCAGLQKMAKLRGGLAGTLWQWWAIAST